MDIVHTLMSGLSRHVTSNKIPCASPNVLIQLLPERKDILIYTAQNMLRVKDIILHDSLIEDIYVLFFYFIQYMYTCK